MQQTDFRFSHPLRVRWAEADMQGIVFNGHYLTYADVGITEYFRALRNASPNADIAGSEYFAVRTLLEYQAPASFDDLLDIHVRIARLGNSSLQFAIGIYRGQELLVKGEIVYVHADMETRRPQTIDSQFREAIHSFETTAPVDAAIERA